MSSESYRVCHRGASVEMHISVRWNGSVVHHMWRRPMKLMVATERPEALEWAIMRSVRRQMEMWAMFIIDDVMHLMIITMLESFVLSFFESI